ncbi:MAG: hypothetical protein WAQ15_08940 [Bacillota bacterium]
MRRAIASIGLIVLLCIVASGCFKMNGGTLEEAQVRAVFDKYEQGAVTGNSEQVASAMRLNSRSLTRTDRSIW